MPAGQHQQETSQRPRSEGSSSVLAPSAGNAEHYHQFGACRAGADGGTGQPYQVSAAVCRALRLADIVLTHEASPAFPYLLAAWEEGFDLALRAAAPATTGHGHAAAPTTSVFEDRFEQFTDCPMTAHVGAVPLMRDLNRVATNSAGLATVPSIVAGIMVAQGNFNLDDPDSAPPLNQGAVCNLVATAAAMCEQMSDSGCDRADWYKEQLLAWAPRHRNYHGHARLADPCCYGHRLR